MRPMIISYWVGGGLLSILLSRNRHCLSPVTRQRGSGEAKSTAYTPGRARAELHDDGPVDVGAF